MNGKHVIVPCISSELYYLFNDFPDRLRYYTRGRYNRLFIGEAQRRVSEEIAMMMFMK